MTPKERGIKALTLKVPDYVPTFELEFQLEDIMFGKKFLHQEDLKDKSPSEREKLIKENAEYMLYVYEKLEYSIIPIHYLDLQGIMDTARYIRKISGDKFMLATHGDGTFSIPDGNEMYEFAYAIADDPEGVKQKAENMALEAIERNKKLADAGFDCLLLCSDYCYNSGPFLSPAMFKEYIQPYLYNIIDEAKSVVCIR